MSTNKQALRQLAVDAKELAIIKRYTKGVEAQKKFIAAANPATVLALLDELETKEEQRANWFQMAEKLGADLDAAERRIAELEAREVDLPKRSVGEVMHMSGFDREYAEGWCSGNDNAIHEIRAAGITVKGE